MAVGAELATKEKEDTLPAIGGYVGKAGVRPMFITQVTEKRLERKAVFTCGAEQGLLWGISSVGH